jgi:hypothetical protein
MVQAHHELFSCAEGGTSASECNRWAVPRGDDGVFTSLPSPAVWFSGSQNPPPAACVYSWVSRNRTPQGAFGSDLNRVI